MNWHRIVLTLVLAGGCVWCLGRVEQVHSQEKAAEAAYVPVATPKALLEVQQKHLADLRKQADSDKPNFKMVIEHAFVVAETFNIAQYEKEPAQGMKSPVEARDLAIAMAKAGKAKDAAGVKKLLADLEKLPHAKKSEKPAEAQPPYKPVAPVHPLMEVQQDYFNAVKKQIAATKPEFEKIASDIRIVGELSNVNRHQSDKADYQEWATQVRELCIELAKGVSAEGELAAKTTKAKELFRQIHTACGKCHDKYQ